MCFTNTHFFFSVFGLSWYVSNALLKITVLLVVGYPETHESPISTTLVLKEEASGTRCTFLFLDSS
jgi:hypothetical protein